MNEADTCRTFVRPRLETAGWDGNNHFFSEQTPFTDGRMIVPDGFNLDIKNPNAKDDFERLPQEQLAEDILQKELRIAEIMREIKELPGRKP